MNQDRSGWRSLSRLKPAPLSPACIRRPSVFVDKCAIAEACREAAMLARRFLYASPSARSPPAVRSSAQVALPTGGTIENVDFERHVMGLLSKAGLQRRLLPRLVPGQERLPPVAVRLRTGDGLRATSPATTSAAASTSSSPTRASLLLKATGQTAPRRRHAVRQGRLGLQHLPRVDPGPARSGRRAAAQIEKLEDHSRRTSPARRRQAAASEGHGDVRRRLDGRHHAVLRLPHQRRRRRRRLAARRSSRPRQPGDAGLIVLYRGSVQADPRAGAVAGRAPASATRRVPEVNYIDREVFAKLKLLNMVPSDLAPTTSSSAASPSTPSASCRRRKRCGRSSPTSDPNKREKKIDELLAHPLHAALWATKFSRHHRQQHATRWSSRSSTQPKRQPDVARLVPQAHRRERALRPDRPRHPDRHQPRRQDARGVGRASSRRSTSRPTKGFEDRLRGARRRSTCSGGGSSRCRSSSGARRSRPRSWASASNAPSATSTRSTAGRRPTTGPSPTSSRR